VKSKIGKQTIILATQLNMVILLGFDVTSGTMEKYLDLVEGDDIDRLNEVLELGHFFF